MLNEADSQKELVDTIVIKGTPFNLSPMLTELMDKQIGMLVKSCNPDIYVSLLRPIKNYAKVKDLACTAQTWGAILPTDHKYKMLSIARRCALGKVWKRFCRKALSKTMSAEEQVSNRQYFCDIVGFEGRKHFCRSSFCPNCLLRAANGTRKDIMAEAKSQDPKTLSAIVLSVTTPFKEQLYGYTPIEQPNIVERLRRKLKMPYYACKTIGVKLNDRRPFSVTNIALFVHKQNRKDLQGVLTTLKINLEKISSEIFVEINEVTGVDNICLALYDCSPFCLAGMSKEGFSDCVLQHTIEEYKCANKGKKRTQFFGLRSE
jgi:hypothetical protein